MNNSFIDKIKFYSITKNNKPRRKGEHTNRDSLHKEAGRVPSKSNTINYIKNIYDNVSQKNSTLSIV